MRAETPAMGEAGCGKRSQYILSVSPTPNLTVDRGVQLGIPKTTFYRWYDRAAGAIAGHFRKNATVFWMPSGRAVRACQPSIAFAFEVSEKLRITSPWR